MTEVGSVEGLLVEHDGARTDDAHFTDEDVPELGELIEAEAAEEAPDAGDAGIALELLVGLPLALRCGVGIE